MRIPRLLQVFVPFGILDRALDESRSKTERMQYGGMFGIFILALAGVILSNFSAGATLSDIFRFIVLLIYACVMVYAMVVGGRSVFRMGKSAQGLAKVGYYTLGVLCIFCGVLLIFVVPYALYSTYGE